MEGIVLNYELEKVAFESNLGTFYYAINTDTKDKNVLLEINRNLYNVNYIDSLINFVKDNKISVKGVLPIKEIFEDNCRYYCVYENFVGKPIAFTLAHTRKANKIKKLVNDLAVILDDISASGLTYGGLSTESIIEVGNDYDIIGVEFYNTKYKLEGNDDLYFEGYIDPTITDYVYSNKSDVYSLGRFVATIFLAEKFYTKDEYPVPNIPELKSVQDAINKATLTEDRFASCKDFAASISGFGGKCPYTDHGSAISSYVYLGVVVLFLIYESLKGGFGG